ncbi:MAG: 2-dehydro-3-deoxy-6-phosphogalactonate aldolase [Rhizobiaceae bacterium]
MSATPWPNLKRGLVAILRGVKPDEIGGIADALIEAGFEAIEIPLNSPDPFRSIETLAKRAPSGVLTGAGTVLTAADVQRLHDVGGNLLVTPNVDPDVIGAAVKLGMVSMPGVFTATEALLALKSGASALKFFPASALGPSGVNAIRAILPKDTVVGAVGGVADGDFAAWMKIGVKAFGLGSSLYKPDASASDVAALAARAVKAYDAALAG